MTLLLLVLVAQDLSQQGAQAMRESRFAEAAVVYRQLAKQQPGVPQWQMNLGLALHSAGDLPAAVRALERYTKLVPAPGAVHWILGVDQLKLQRGCAAADTLEKARRWRGSNEVVAALADACSACKRYAEAAGHYEALKRTREAARARWQAAEYTKAKALFGTLKEWDAAAHYEYGDTLLRLEETEKAIGHLQEAREIPAARAALGKALAQMERWVEAVPLLEEAARADASLLLPLSKAYAALGRKEEAAQALRAFQSARQ
jgi:tetratricopeptide (TPR) repeat protein